MGDMLSQAEINALLGDVSGSGEDEANAETATAEAGESAESPTAGTGEKAGSATAKAGDNADSASAETGEDTISAIADADEKAKQLNDLLTDEQKDILGEIGNISMGTSATTLFALLGRKVLITTPKVNAVYWDTLSKGYQRPCVGIRVNYVEGIEGANVLVLKQRDVKVISSLMMGGDGIEGVDGDLNEIDLSAIGEAMNQMVGSASTSLSSIINLKIDIDTPKAFVLDFNNDDFLSNLEGVEDDPIVCVSFRMEIGNLVDSEIMQIIPYKFALQMVQIVKGGLVSEIGAPEPPTIQEQQIQPVAPPNVAPVGSGVGIQMPQTQAQINQPAVNVTPVQFQNFDANNILPQKENINIIMDVPLEISVELGRTVKSIKEILEFSPGTIIELDKLAGEPIDVLVNGKFIAKGEVVVIEENFCIRITDIINVENRI